MSTLTGLQCSDLVVSSPFVYAEEEAGEGEEKRKMEEGKGRRGGREGLGMTGRDDSVMLSPFVYGDRF